MDELIIQIVTALRTRSTLPQFPISLSEAEAYEIQHQVVASLGTDSIAGIKAGLTSPASQKAFGITHPVIGHLFESGRLLSGGSLQTNQGVFLECEIGVYVNASGTPTSVGPVIEVPRFAFQTPADAVGPNLIACNVASDRYIVGKFSEPPATFTQSSVQLSRDGSVLCQASFSEALGGPMNSLAWMLTEVQTRDFSIPDDALLLTGACGGIHPALPGSYVADYGSLGRIEFEILAEKA